jgi:hypothetical protein
MDIDSILVALDAEIAQLQQVRAVLAQSGSGASVEAKTRMPAKKRGSKRTLSAEARKRIAEAQKKRWAAMKKATNPQAAKATTGKKAATPKKTEARAK